MPSMLNNTNICATQMAKNQALPTHQFLSKDEKLHNNADQIY